MILSRAEELLEQEEKKYFLCYRPNNVLKYIAIVKKDINSNHDDNYQLEIGYTYLDPIRVDNKRSKLSVIEKVFYWYSILKLNSSTIEDIIKGNIAEPLDLNLIENIRNNKNQDFECNEILIDKKKYDKIESGISIANKKFEDFSGTLGALFRMKKGGNIYMLSNFHVLASKKSKLSDNEIITQPSRIDVNQTLGGKHKPNNIGTLFWMYNDEKVDAAIAKVINEDIVANNKSKCLLLHRLGKIEKPKIGMDVIKCGRSSNISKGTIRSINCTVNLSNKTDPSEDRIKRNQILTTYMSCDGDSGSVLIDENTNNVVGLIFASNDVNATYANNIQNIFYGNHKEYNGQKLPKISFYEFI